MPWRAPPHPCAYPRTRSVQPIARFASYSVSLRYGSSRGRLGAGREWSWRSGTRYSPVSSTGVKNDGNHNAAEHMDGNRNGICMPWHGLARPLSLHDSQGGVRLSYCTSAHATPEDWKTWDCCTVTYIGSLAHHHKPRPTLKLQITVLPSYLAIFVLDTVR